MQTIPLRSFTKVVLLVWIMNREWIKLGQWAYNRKINEQVDFFGLVLLCIHLSINDFSIFIILYFHLLSFKHYKGFVLPPSSITTNLCQVLFFVIQLTRESVFIIIISNSRCREISRNHFLCY